MIEFEGILQELREEEYHPGLFIVATDIGNRGDITLRALNILQRADLVICEERRMGESLLKRYGIKKPLELLNEHNESEQTRKLLLRLSKQKEIVALISDNGTPLFADPGSRLVEQCLQSNIPVSPVPGASSLMAALMVAGRSDDKFLYYGFLPAGKSERISALKALKRERGTDIVLLETPYRLKVFLRDMKMVLGGNRRGIIAYKLTSPEERILSGQLSELVKITEDLPKGEFVFVLLAEVNIKKSNVRS